MMKYFLLILTSLLIVSCNDNSKDENETKEELPEGKWNGEYMEVESEDDDDKKRPSKKSNGSEILNLGKVVYAIDGKEEKISQFDKRKSDVTINKDQIAIRIKDANERFFIIGIHKDEIYKNPKGKYIDVANKKDDSDPMFTLSYTSNKNDLRKTYQFKNGSLEVHKMSLSTGAVLITAKGELLNMKDIQKGNTNPFEIEIKMTFETVVSAFNPEG